MTLTQQPNTIKLLIKKLIVANIALMGLLMLAFTICRMTSIGAYSDTYAESGFSFLAFESQFFANSNGVGVFFIGFFCMLMFLASFVTIPLAVFNVIFRKKFKADMPIIIISLITAFIYMIIGIIVSSVVASEFAELAEYILVTTSAYVPFLLQTTLLAGYIVVSKVLPETTGEVQPQATPVARAPQVVQQATPVAPAPQVVQQATPVAPAPQPAPVQQQAKSLTAMERIETIKKYAELKDSGILSEEEFNAIKKDLLGL